MEIEEQKPREVFVKCDCQMEAISFTFDDDKGYEDTVYMNVYKMYDH